MKITFVKKIKLDGTPCAKCADVQEQLEKNQQLRFISRTVIADERDPESEGMKLAVHYQVDRAPFFLVEKDSGEVEVHTVYLKFAKEVLQHKSSARDEIADIMESNPDLDFL